MKVIKYKNYRGKKRLTVEYECWEAIIITLIGMTFSYLLISQPSMNLPGNTAGIIFISGIFYLTGIFMAFTMSDIIAINYAKRKGKIEVKQ